MEYLILFLLLFKYRIFSLGLKFLIMVILFKILGFWGFFVLYLLIVENIFIFRMFIFNVNFGIFFFGIIVLVILSIFSFIFNFFRESFVIFVIMV